MPVDKRKIVYLSGTRADFGLMRSSLLLMNADIRFDLGIVVTGMHLEPIYGSTVGDIENAGLKIIARIPTDVRSRTGLGMATSIAQTLQGLAETFKASKPDVLVLLGDRGEMLAGAVAAMHLGIVVVHIHGGERSGTVDEPIRHAVSKLSHYHFVATKQAKKRLIRMGENASNVYLTGAPGLDGLEQAARSVSDADFHNATGLNNKEAFILCIFHPVVQQAHDAFKQTCALRLSLRAIGIPVIWCTPNADAGSDEILRAMTEIPLPQGSVTLTHLGRPLFCAAMHHCRLMVGNSSSGIIEAATLGARVLNVGDRQHGRETGANVMHVPVDEAAIFQGAKTLLALSKQSFKNVYGYGDAGTKIIQILTDISIDAKVLEKFNAY
jgi:GDP/UDP-N,N'-diacetylbacillosamine 2-epimerase (hydrolysing)